MKELDFVDIGEGITEGHIQKWLFKDGDAVKADEAVVQIETDKAVVNIPAPISGTIRINIPENSDVKVGEVLAYIGQPAELAGIVPGRRQGSEHGSAQPQPSIPVRASEPNATQPVSAHPQREVLATPGIRKLARDIGVDLSILKGTGPGGRIQESDVKAAAGSAKGQIRQAQAKMPNESYGGEIEIIPMSQPRKAIARNMEASWAIPKAVHMDIINANALYGVVERERTRAESQRGIKLGYLPFIIKATVAALKENPYFNSTYDKEKQEIILKKYYNIGLAAEAPDGLRVAVIKNADKKGVLDIAKELRELGDKVKSLTISPEEMRDSTFTISNIGSLGGGYLSFPAINYPEVAILAVHLVRDAPVVENGQIKVGKILPFSISFDHRIVDGAEAVKFGNAIMGYLQDPAFLGAL
jgi:pyruvate dehydrogenase E2 component (dihydrolipoamide acetyltransferase)